MLVHLHVKNLALIDEAEVDFQEGLNILTGETGAGKSILIGSVNLALGQKMSRGIIREGAGNALVELVFQVRPDTEEKLKEMGGTGDYFQKNYRNQKHQQSKWGNLYSFQYPQDCRAAAGYSRTA